MEPAAAVPAPAPARTGWVILAALVTQIVIIGAACNQWVAVRIGDQIARSANGSITARDFKITMLVFNWRFAPQGRDPQHIWLGQIFMIMTLLAVTAALISLLAAGPATFGRVFFATWVSVVFATVLACFVRGLVNTASDEAAPRVTRAMFGTLGPDSYGVIAGVLLGFVTGLVAAIVAVKTAPAAAEEEPGPIERTYFPPEQPPPYYGEQIVRPWQSEHAGALPTTQLPAVEQPATPGAPADQATTRFPRPPDDDELGHV